MATCDERDDWLEGVRRWYFGGTPGPTDDLPGAGDGDAPIGSVGSDWQADESLALAHD